jgi:hypothetical protein
MPGARRSAPSRSRILPRLILVVLAVAAALLGPRLVRAHSALQWARFHARQAPDAFGQAARGAARWASVVVKESAPLPWAAEAGRLALDVGARHEVANPAASLALYEQVKGALEAVKDSGWRGYGMEALLEEASRRERDLRARPDIVTPRP